MSYSTFLYEVADGIATVRLNNPDKLNALTFETYEELEQLFADLAQDNQVKVVIITGSGKGFCSGGSVHEIIGKLIDMSADELHRFTRMTCNVTKHMRNLKKPIIAAVNGIAAGAGTMLALASDIRLVSDRAKFAFLFVKVEHEKLVQEADELARRLKQGPLQAIGVTKNLLERETNMRLGKRVDPGGSGASRLHGNRGFQKKGIEPLWRSDRRCSTALSY